MGETGQARGLSDAARGRAPGRLAARPALKTFWRDESGSSAVELGIIVALVVVVLVAGLTVLTNGLGSAFQKASTAVGS
ncbi:Flp family type IVb pilin [Caulobacter segnis]|uniref:Flp family type IVb pilin n=1 Tax=Caulobacter segnis TaxID=88688 RepID=UPI001CBFAA55|nr:Flp family type IVb pilin [Caulobacter segnis]UAL11510.1 Flp family type IVb pilin [Caulobacter segnis]